MNLRSRDPYTSFFVCIVSCNLCGDQSYRPRLAVPAPARSAGRRQRLSRMISPSPWGNRRWSTSPSQLCESRSVSGTSPKPPLSVRPRSWSTAKPVGNTSLIVWEQGGERQFFNVAVHPSRAASDDSLTSLRRANSGWRFQDKILLSSRRIISSSSEAQ